MSEYERWVICMIYRGKEREREQKNQCLDNCVSGCGGERQRGRREGREGYKATKQTFISSAFSSIKVSFDDDDDDEGDEGRMKNERRKKWGERMLGERKRMKKMMIMMK